ncbi:Crp/Fnr family transcriptional regulator [Pseudoalteromonas sp. BZB3]|uniref:Crp/Fnr family transcriptional regulator n=1 Tax=Pseudoalteromonas sp. BZB3 TaxID=3136670 RepID=UPI0032C48D02
MQAAFTHLEQTLKKYAPLSDQALNRYFSACHFIHVAKGTTLYAIGEIPSSFAFIHKGLMRAYLIDEEGNEFNKNFFAEGRFPGSMSALLNNQTSFLGIEALEDCDIITIDFKQFRRELFADHELMAFHINYLEQHWLLEKEPKEIGYLQHEAKQRYMMFLDKYEAILSRLPQYHIASYLGITPTQLSRIRKDLNNQSCS